MYCWVFLLLYCRGVFGANPTLNRYDKETVLILVGLVSDIIKDSDDRVAKMEVVKHRSIETAPFEVGYLTHILQEKYGKMVDKYHTCKDKLFRFYVIENILFLEEIERHYWQIEHVANMMHEIERKYNITSGLHEKYSDESQMTTTTTTTSKASRFTTTRRKRFKAAKYLKNYLGGTRPPRGKARLWPLDYGWEINYYW